MKTKLKCLNCKKTIKGIGIDFYGKESCLNCYNEYMNNKKIIKGGYNFRNNL